MNQLKQFSRSFAFSRTLRQLKGDSTDQELQDYLRKVPKYKKVRANMKRFQEDNGIPIHLKGGLWDKILLNLIIVELVGGFVYGIYWTVKTKIIDVPWYCSSQNKDD
ncbi:hypothetical protein M8J77_018580 [Diaphorina citri]|nr:hypothetical protein M8J77_018580 [Diaphorina citri]